MTGYKRHREMEVYLTTFDGAQHLRLHGWLKRNDTLIKSENIVDQDDYFGVFMVYITENQLNKLKENNTESSLFMDLEVMSTESERWNLFQSIKDKENKDNLFDKIQDFMFSFQIKDKDDIEKFLTQANNTSIALFKKSKDFIDDYIETEEMNYGDKVKDLDIMIEAFIEEERYEDCAILVKIKKKMKKYYLQKQKTK
tara:strand:+ start:232 stop:825 length:594 start_codon:yes stop_codon:yes gene_type:complete